MAKKQKKRRATTVLTRNAQSWTEAEYWGRVRGALRQVFSRWKPAQAAFKLAECGTRTSPKTGREKKIYRCASCGDAGYREEMQVDHIEPCGALRSPEDIAPFLAQLTCEDTSQFQLLHKKCHQAKTNEARFGKPGQYPQSAIVGVDYATGPDKTVTSYVPPGDHVIKGMKAN